VLALVGFVGLCLLVAAADGSVITGLPRGWYLSLNRPPGTLPDWTFLPIWLAIDAMMGVAGWLAWRTAISIRPLRLWGWQLAADACWTPAFFALHSPPLTLAVSVVMLVLVVLTIRAFAAVRPVAAWFMGPYLVWAGYATFLSAGFWWLNPS
jgi:tryptophan-rich sensory protein